MASETKGDEPNTVDLSNLETFLKDWPKKKLKGVSKAFRDMILAIRQAINPKANAADIVKTIGDLRKALDMARRLTDPSYEIEQAISCAEELLLIIPSIFAKRLETEGKKAMLSLLKGRLYKMVSDETFATFFLAFREGIEGGVEADELCKFFLQYHGTPAWTLLTNGMQDGEYKIFTGMVSAIMACVLKGKPVTDISHARDQLQTVGDRLTDLTDLFDVCKAVMRKEVPDRATAFAILVRYMNSDLTYILTKCVRKIIWQLCQMEIGTIIDADMLRFSDDLSPPNKVDKKASKEERDAYKRKQQTYTTAKKAFWSALVKVMQRALGALGGEVTKETVTDAIEATKKAASTKEAVGAAIAKALDELEQKRAADAGYTA